MLRFFLSICCLVTPAFAEPVYVRGSEDGQAFTFNQLGTCFAILPDHVSRRQAFQIRTATPTREGTGTMTSLRFPDSDLALATVRGGAATGCLPSWSDLYGDLRGVLRLGGEGVLTTVRASGVVEQIPVTISPITYEHIGVTPANPDDLKNFAKGRSGSILSVDGTPVGIAIDLPKGWGAEMRVLRIDAIKARLARFIQTARPVISAPMLSRGDDPVVPFEVVSWSASPLNPENDPTVLSSGEDIPFLAEPNPAGFSFRLRLGPPDGPAVKFRRIEFETQLNEDVTGPKSVVLYAPRRADDRKPRRLASGIIGPDGRGTIKVRPTNVSWLDVVITGAWHPDKILRIDSMSILSD